MITRHLLVTLICCCTLLLVQGCGNNFKARRLAGCDTNPVQFSFVCPKGKIKYLLLGIPKSHARKTFSGIVRIQEDAGKPVGDFDFSSDTARYCNWLDAEQLDGYILTWDKPTPWEGIKPDGKYIITVDLRQSPTDSSLWLYWGY